MELLIVLALTVPVFYIIGLASFIRFLTKSNRSSRKELLADLINELQSYKKAHGAQTIDQILKVYEKELGQPIPSTSPAVNLSLESGDKPSRVSTSSWYQDNSINLLLYLGAFLIVASASIFVAFSWEVIGGGVKTLVLSVITVGFLISGLTFYRQSKIRQAGLTFTAISALLLPFCGVAWYNFVLKDQGVSLGLVWLLTSVLAMLVYSYLAWSLRNRFYVFSLALGQISTVLSLVNLAQLNQDFYIFGGMFSAYILLSTALLTRGKIRGMFAEPLKISSLVTMPTSILIGLFWAVNQDRLLSVTTGAGILVSAVYYLTYFFVSRKAWSFGLSLGLLPFSLWILTRLHPPYGSTLVGLTLVEGLYLGMATVIGRHKEVFKLSVTVAETLSIITFIIGYADGASSLSLAIYALIASLIWLIGGYLLNRSWDLLLTNLFLAIASFVWIDQVLRVSQSGVFLGILYGLLGSLNYIAGWKFRRFKELFNSLLIAAVGYVLVALSVSYFKQAYFLGILLLGLGLLADGARRFDKKELYFGLSLGLAVWWYYLLLFFKLDQTYFSLIYTLLWAVMYLAFRLNPKLEPLRSSSLVGSITTTLIFGFLPSILQNQSLTEQMGVYSTYLIGLLWWTDGYLSRERSVKYIASGITLVAYFWSIKFWQVHQLQAYILPLGAYCLGLSYSRKLLQDKPNQQILDYLGLGILLIFTFFQAVGAGGFKYALLLSLEGIGLILMGISWRYKLYRFGGVAFMVVAVISQTYEYLYSLPRWILTGSLGLIFLVVATTLLLKRKN